MLQNGPQESVFSTQTPGIEKTSHGLLIHQVVMLIPFFHPMENTWLSAEHYPGPGVIVMFGLAISKRVKNGR
jgi:hypothetical protein